VVAILSLSNIITESKTMFKWVVLIVLVLTFEDESYTTYGGDKFSLHTALIVKLIKPSSASIEVN